MCEAISILIWDSIKIKPVKVFLLRILYNNISGNCRKRIKCKILMKFISHITKSDINK